MMIRVRDDIDVLADGGVRLDTAYDDEKPPIEMLLRTLAALEDTPLTELDPLYEAVEPDALSGLLQHANEHDRIVGVEFSYGGFIIAINGDGDIRIHDGSPQIAHTEGETD